MTFRTPNSTSQATSTSPSPSSKPLPLLPVYISPKRKRESPPPPPVPSPTSKHTKPVTILAPSFRDTPIVDALPDRVKMNGSPRTRVAYHFEGLAIDSRAPASKLDLLQASATSPSKFYNRSEEALIRKRVKILSGQDSLRETPETPPTAAKTFKINIGEERVVDPVIRDIASQVELRNEVDPLIFRAAVDRFKSQKSDAIHKALPSAARLNDLKARRGKAGTPPLKGTTGEKAGVGKVDGKAALALQQDPKALTWHDDEITGHNPNDPDDDGEGINGVGFRPTAAVAYKRMEARRAQMESYKIREAKEARAKRSERRRAKGRPEESIGTQEVGGRREERETARRVRFLEIERKSIPSKSSEGKPSNVRVGTGVGPGSK